MPDTTFHTKRQKEERSLGAAPYWPGGPQYIWVRQDLRGRPRLAVGVPSGINNPFSLFENHILLHIILRSLSLYISFSL